MTSLLQTGLNGHLPAPPEKRFLISSVVENEQALTGLSQPLQGRPDRGQRAVLGWDPRGHGVKQQDIVLIAHVADVSRKVFQVLDVAVGARNVVEQSVKSRDVEGMAAGDDGNRCVVGYG